MTTTEATASPVELFYSYTHRDEALRDELEKHLSIMKRQGVITGWHDRKIGAGAEWAGEIDRHLDTAGVILLLVSSDFIASDYCYGVEVKRAMERHEAGGARVVPVILRPCDWHPAPFGKLQALPRDGKPVVSWADRDEAFLDVAKGVRRVVQAVNDARSPRAGAGTATGTKTATADAAGTATAPAPGSAAPGAPTPQQIHAALLSAFPRLADLRQMVGFGMNENLDAVAGGTSVSDVVYNLIGWARAQNRLDELIRAARQQNSGNVPLREVARSLLGDS